LRLKVVSWKQLLALQSNGLGLFGGLVWLHHMKSLANVTMATIICNLLKDKTDIKAVMLPVQPDVAV
jgi:hypothetical protein